MLAAGYGGGQIAHFLLPREKRRSRESDDPDNADDVWPEEENIVDAAPPIANFVFLLITVAALFL